MVYQSAPSPKPRGMHQTVHPRPMGFAFRRHSSHMDPGCALRSTTLGFGAGYGNQIISSFFSKWLTADELDSGLAENGKEVIHWDSIIVDA